MHKGYHLGSCGRKQLTVHVDYHHQVNGMQMHLSTQLGCVAGYEALFEWRGISKLFHSIDYCKTHKFSPCRHSCSHTRHCSA